MDQQTLFRWFSKKTANQPSPSKNKPPPPSIKTTATPTVKKDPGANDVAPNDQDKTSAKRSSPSSVAVIDLCSPGKDESPATATVDDRKRKSSFLDDDDDECVVVDAPNRTMTTTAAFSSSANDDDDLEIIGATGQNALEDFPHSRQDCVIFPFKNKANVTDATRHCKNCYCYVCDIKAIDCHDWISHCRAKKGDYSWEMRRRRAKRERRQQESGSTDEATRNLARLPFQFNAVEALPVRLPVRRSIQQTRSQSVRPSTRRTRSQQIRALQPSAIIAMARRRQIATNMLEQEIQDARAEVLQEEAIAPPDKNATDASHLSVPRLLKKVSQNHETEATPPAGIFTTKLRSYQKQSLSFMKNLESRVDTPSSGWLASEVGMGKSAIVLALVASDQLVGSTSRKTTVVLTSVSLMGQWEDEAKKHAPGLTIRRFHPPSRSKVALDLTNYSNRSEIRKTDIILSTATFEWPASVTSKYEFHRVVIDEAHLLGNTRTANLLWAKKLKANRKWCVTATPCTASILDLKSQMQFLGLDGGHFKRVFDKLVNATSSISTDDKAFEDFADIFSRHVTRHEKSQLIGGSDALSLPSKVKTIVTLKMSSDEKACFEKNLKSIDSMRMKQYCRVGVAPFTLQQKLIHPLSSDKLSTDYNNSTKISALLQEMKRLEKDDPNFRAVVYTQYSNTHHQVVSALNKFFFIQAVYQITGSTTATERDAAIRVFQGPRTYPAVIVIMMRSGSTGMTLTQASNLYLMEPSLDPATEIQAMGRINRLGQERDTEVKTFVFSDSVEANIVALHKEIESGRIEMNKSKITGKAVKILTSDLSL